MTLVVGECQDVKLNDKVITIGNEPIPYQIGIFEGLFRDSIAKININNQSILSFGVVVKYNNLLTKYLNNSQPIEQFNILSKPNANIIIDIKHKNNSINNLIYKYLERLGYFNTINQIIQNHEKIK